MVQLFDAVGAMVEGGDSVMRSHLSSLVAEAEQPGGGAAAGASLPRLQATASAGAASAYPVLPPNQSFREVSASVGAPSNLAAIVGALSLEPPPPQIEPALRAREWAAVGLSPNEPAKGQLVAAESVESGGLVVEYCGELRTDADFLIAELASAGAIWPPQLCALRFNSRSAAEPSVAQGGACAVQLALDVSRVASVARFAAHSSVPTCELRAYLVDGAPRLAIVAKKALEPGEIVTVD